MTNKANKAVKAAKTVKKPKAVLKKEIYLHELLKFFDFVNNEHNKSNPNNQDGLSNVNKQS